MNTKKIYNVLRLLETKVDKSIKSLKEATMSDDELLSLAKKHFAYEEKISALYDQLAKEEAGLDNTDAAIIQALSAVKGKTKKLGRIFMKLQNTKTIIKGKNTYSYKGIFEDIQQAFELEQKILNPIIEKHSKVAVDSVRNSTDLIMKKESAEVRVLKNFIEESTGKKVILSEGILSSIKDAFVFVFRKYFKSYSSIVIWLH